MASESSTRYVLVTGGAGYIGSHTVLELLKTNEYQPVVVDNLYNSSEEAVHRVEKITGKKVDFVKMDLQDAGKVRQLFEKYRFYCVMHFAGLKAVGESVQLPLLYYRNNIDIAVNLLDAMKASGVRNFIFSSSATVYGLPQYLPLDERHPVGNCSNPYGKTKFFVEEILRDLCKSEDGWNVISLRYFNPVGAHESGEIGEDPKGIPNNLMPFISQVAIGLREELKVYGNDYDTGDGTGVRDYIHVVDLAQGHVAALTQIRQNCGFKIYNLGSGTGTSVLELHAAMEKAVGKKIPYSIVGRREGDVATCYADPSLAEKELKWKTRRTIAQGCEDAWRWQSKNPNGFKK